MMRKMLAQGTRAQSLFKTEKTGDRTKTQGIPIPSIIQFTVREGKCIRLVLCGMDIQEWLKAGNRALRKPFQHFTTTRGMGNLCPCGWKSTTSVTITANCYNSYNKAMQFQAILT